MEADWSLPSRSIAFMLCGRHSAAVGGPPHFICCAMNMFFEPLELRFGPSQGHGMVSVRGHLA
jgi:hypothetical protein